MHLDMEFKILLFNNRLKIRAQIQEIDSRVSTKNKANIWSLVNSSTQFT